MSPVLVSDTDLAGLLKTLEETIKPEIDKLRAEVERLTRERDEARATAKGFAHAADTEKAEAKAWRSRAQAAEAQVVALREALVSVCLETEVNGHMDMDHHAYRAARAALGETPAPSADGHTKEGGTT
jgi:FtsZ-binding cell division protein ZapB